jgi:hypothetical protein
VTRFANAHQDGTTYRLDLDLVRIASKIALVPRRESLNAMREHHRHDVAVVNLLPLDLVPANQP